MPPAASAPPATARPMHAAAVLLAAVLWGTTGTAQELGPADIDANAIASAAIAS